MAIVETRLDKNEQNAIKFLIEAMMAQPGRDEAELKLTISTLSRYMATPTNRLFSMAKMAFDDIEADTKKAIQNYAIQQARNSAGATVTQGPLDVIIKKLSASDLSNKKSSGPSPLLAAIQGL
ncbi:MAG: hypothetical protein WCO00_17290 [Rhodospirillaceae bacterium]